MGTAGQIEGRKDTIRVASIFVLHKGLDAFGLDLFRVVNVPSRCVSSTARFVQVVYLTECDRGCDGM